MYRPATDWNPKQTRLREIIKKPDCFDEAISLCLSLHSFVHLSSVTDAQNETLADMVYEGLVDNDYQIMPTEKDVTIAWNIWHITRIEDIAMNILVANHEQVLTMQWLSALGTKITDTGNAMGDPEILSLSKALNTTKLWEYRSAVGKRSRQIVAKLKPNDLGRRFSKEQKNRIVQEGGLTDHPQSIWLKDFWGKKDIAGILLLPLTRHQAGHLNDCLKLKKKVIKCRTET